MTLIFPPILESQHEAIWYNGEKNLFWDTDDFELKFLMPQMNAGTTDIRHLQLSIRWKNQNRSAVNKDYSPDNATLYLAIPDLDDPDGKNPDWSYNRKTGICTVRVPYPAFEGGRPKEGGQYIIQVRFGSNDLWDGVAPGWHTKASPAINTWQKLNSSAVPSPFGEWSNTQSLFCVSKANTTLKVDTDNFVPRVVWQYSPKDNSPVDDPISQVILQYDWDTKDVLGNSERQFRTETFSGQEMGSNVFNFSKEVPIAPVVNIHFSITAITINNTKYVDNYTLGANTFENYQLLSTTPYPGVFEDAPLTTEQVDDGCIAKRFAVFSGPGDDVISYAKVFRYDLKTFDCVEIKTISPLDIGPGTLAERYTVKDYTVAMGEEYQYVVALFDGVGVARYLMAENRRNGPGTPGYARLMKMEVSFLDDKLHQLRLQGGVQISSFKRNTSDQFQTTIGGQFPYYIRNGKQNYRSFGLTATISINFDPTFTFLRFRDGIGLTWEGGNGVTQLVASEDDLFRTTEFSHSRWRLGHPNGDRKERAKLDELGLDAERELYRFYMLLEEYRNAYIYRDTKTALTNAARKNAQTNLINLAKELYGETYLTTLATTNMEKEFDEIWSNILAMVAKRNAAKTAEDRVYYEKQVAIWQKRLTKADPINLYIPDLETFKSQQYQASEAGLTAFHPKLFKDISMTIGTDQTNENIYLERKFREAVMNWLSNGKPKLFRSETEGNMIVMITAPSFSPLEKTQRMVYNMSCTVTEIAEYNLANLIEYNLVPSEIVSDYVKQSEWEYTEKNQGNPDPWINNDLQVRYMQIYDIPSMMVGTTMKVNDLSYIDVYLCAINGVKPYKFKDLTGRWVSGSTTDTRTTLTWFTQRYEALRVIEPKTTDQLRKWRNYQEVYQQIKNLPGLPKGFTITEDTGRISGKAEEPHEQTTATILVIDASDNHESGFPDVAALTINVGRFYDKLALNYITEIAGNTTVIGGKTMALINAKSAGNSLQETQQRVTIYASNNNKGTPPYTWSASNLPAGLSLQVEPDYGINFGSRATDFTKANSCMIVGTFTQELSETGVITIACRDSVGLVETIQVAYRPVTYPITLRLLDEWKLLEDWEEGYKIRPQNFALGVFGGSHGNILLTDAWINKENAKLKMEIADSLGNIDEYNRQRQIMLDNDASLTYRTRWFTFCIREKAANIDWSKWNDPTQNQLPEGITLEPSGLLHGTPRKYSSSTVAGYPYPLPAKTYVVRVYDNELPDSYDEIEITIGEIYAMFVFEAYITDKIETDWSHPKPTDPAAPVGTVWDKFDVMVDGKVGTIPPVHGGKPRTSDPKPYSFFLESTAPNILTNFNISTAGVLTGYAVQTADAGTVWIVAEDARGHRVSQPFSVPRIVGDFSFANKTYKIPEQWIDGSTGGYAPDNTPTDENHEWVEFTLENGAFEGYEEAAETARYGELAKKWQFWEASLGGGWPDGIKIGVFPDTLNNKNPRVVIYGRPTQVHAGGAMTVHVTDGLGRQASKTIELGTIYHKFRIETNRPVVIDETDVSLCDAIQPVKIPLLTQGKEAYEWVNEEEVNEALYPYKLPESPMLSGSNNYITGVPSEPKQATTVIAKVRDQFGVIHEITIQVGKIKPTGNMISATQLNCQFMVGRSTIQASDGIYISYPAGLNGNPEFYYEGRKCPQTLPNGMVLQLDGRLTGTATVVGSSFDLGKNVTIMDSGATNAKPIQCPSWIMPPCVPVPTRNPEVFGTVANDKLEIKGLTQNSSFGPTKPIFLCSWQKTKVELSVPFPRLIRLATDYTIWGNLEVVTTADIVSKVTLTCLANDYTPAYTVDCEITFKPVNGIFQLVKDPIDLHIPPLDLNGDYNSMAKGFEVGKGLQGGQEPFTWDITGLPAGMRKYEVGNTCYVIGSPTETKGNYIITVTVTDAYGKKSSIDIDCYGVYPPLNYNFGGVNVPAHNKGEALTPIKLENFVIQGVGPYTFSDVAGEIGKYGYIIDQQGFLSGNAGEKTRAAGQAQLKVLDNGTGNFKIGLISIGKVTGDIAAKMDAMDLSSRISAGRNQAVDITVYCNDFIERGDTGQKTVVLEGEFPWTGGIVTFTPTNGNLVANGGARFRINGRTPNAPTAAKTFVVRVADTTGSASVVFYLPQIT